MGIVNPKKLPGKKPKDKPKSGYVKGGGLRKKVEEPLLP